MDRSNKTRLQSYGCHRARLEDGVQLLLAANVFPTIRKYRLTTARNWDKIEYTVRNEIAPDIRFIEQDEFEKECEKRLLYAKAIIEDYEAYKSSHPEPENATRLWKALRSISRYKGTPLIEEGKKNRYFSSFRRNISENYDKIKNLPAPVLPAKSTKLFSARPIKPQPSVPETPPLQGEAPQEKKQKQKQEKPPIKHKAKIIPFRPRETVE